MGRARQFQVAALLAAMGMARGMALAQGTVAGQPMMARDADPDWEAVTVRPTDVGTTGDSFVVLGRHVMIKNRTMENLLLIAYGVHKSQIVGAPEWVRTQHFDVNGVPDVDGEPNPKQIQSLMRRLLKERFGLVVHTEQRELPVYAVTVAKDGAKLTASQRDANEPPDESIRNNGGDRTMLMTNATVGDLGLMLEVELDRPVVDKTGLKGRYDFQLRYTADAMRARPDEEAAPVVFTAVQEQLGLKLEPVKTQADVLVVDKVNMPGAN